MEHSGGVAGRRWVQRHETAQMGAGRVLAAMGLRWADSWRAGARTLPMNAGCAASIGVPIGPSVIEL